MNNQKSDEKILQVKNLQTWFWTDAGIVKAVDGVSFDLHKREMLAIVGESGSGKSVTNLAIMNLIPNPPGKIIGGEVWFGGKDVLKMDKQEIRQLRGNKISMIFQDPMTSLNPFLKISTQMIETIRLHQGLSKKDARDRAIEMLKLVGIPAAEKRVDCYPHQFSGGMRQRVMIAMGLSADQRVGRYHSGTDFGLNRGLERPARHCRYPDYTLARIGSRYVRPRMCYVCGSHCRAGWGG